MKIKTMARGVFAEETGWSFVIDFEDEMIPEPKEYRTNKNYEGLFIWQESNQNWSQCLGTGQFCLSDIESKAKKQIIAQFSKNT